MTVNEGFILSNKFRKAIFNSISSGEKNIDRIAKKHHIVPRIAKRVLEDLIDENIVKNEKGAYVLTKKGKRIAEKIEE